MADRPNIDIATLRQLLAYDPDKGKLTWLRRPVNFFPDERAQKIWNTRYAGSEAFTCNSGGYRIGNLFNRRTKAHRVAYALHYGKWPAGSIDHINGNPADNRIANLRAVDHGTNMRNMRMKKNNTSGVTGVSFWQERGKWLAQITFEHRNRNLGYFDNFEDAVAARKSAEKRFGFHRNHGL